MSAEEENYGTFQAITKGFELLIGYLDENDQSTHLKLPDQLIAYLVERNGNLESAITAVTDLRRKDEELFKDLKLKR